MMRAALFLPCVWLVLAALLSGGVALAAPPAPPATPAAPGARDPMAGISPAEQKEIDAGAEVARKEAPAMAGEPGRKVLSVKPMVPFIYFVDLGGDQRFQVLVVDGHIVKEKSDKAIARWLEKTHFLEKSDPAAEARLLAVLNEWGQMPLGFEQLRTDLAPSAEQPKPGLSFAVNKAGRSASLLVYTQWRKRPKPPAEGERVRMELGPIMWLRGTLRIDSKYQLKWTIEQLTNNKWRPFRG